MSHWPYIAASYVLTIGGMGGLTLWSWVRMRGAEAKAGALSKPIVPSEVEGRVSPASVQRPSTSLGTSEVRR